MEFFAIKLAVAKYFRKESGTYGLASMHGHYGRSPIRMPKKVVTALHSHDFKPDFL